MEPDATFPLSATRERVAQSAKSTGPLIEPGNVCPGSDLLHLLFRHNPEAVLLVEMGGRILEANPAACQLAGCNREEMLTLRPWNFILGATRLEIQEWMRTMAKGTTQTVRLAYRTRTGKRGMLEAVIQRVDDPQLDGFVASCRDLPFHPAATGLLPPGMKVAANEPARIHRAYRQQLLQLQRHNEALVEAEQRLRLAIELGRVGLWVWNATDTTNPGHWSDRLKEIFGLPLDAEVTHDMFLKCVHPADREPIDRAVGAALSGENGGRYSTEYRTIHPENGTEGWVLARGQAFFNAEGQAVRFIGTVMDITERKRAEEALTRLNAELEQRIADRTAELECTNRTLVQEITERQRAEMALKDNEHNLQLVIDTIPGLVWRALPEGNIEYLNQRWLDYTGLSLEQASGWGWQQAIHPDDLAGLLDYWKSILTEGKAGETEARLRRHDGEYRWFLFRGVPFHDEAGNLIKWYGTNTDVEERRTSETLARGQSEALIQTLNVLSQESNPERFLEHVLRTIGGRLGAHSIGVWEVNKDTGCVELVANCEGDHLQTVQDQESTKAVQFPTSEGDHPVWTEFLRNGKHCLAGEMDGGTPRVRVLDGTDSPWYDWYADAVANPNVPVLLQRLCAMGVMSTLSVPMFVAGEVTGFLSVRFQRNPEFRCEEIELARALAHQAMLAIQLMRLSQQSRHLAVVAERNRMARELHDTLAQGFTGVIVQLEAAEDAGGRGLREAADQHLKRARELARSSLREARRSVRAMRPQALKGGSLCTALEDLFKNMTEGTGLQAEFVLRGEPWKLRPKFEENLLRISQEVLTNTLRHAGASLLRARLTFTPREVQLQLHDNGRGFDLMRRHDGFGLTGIRERVEGMGGRLFIRSAMGRGTFASIRLPVLQAASSPTS